MGDDSNGFITLFAQVSDSRIQARCHFIEQGKVVFQGGVVGQYRHLHRQGRVAVVGQSAAQPADQPPVGVHAQTVYHDHRGPGRIGLGVNAQKLAPAGLEVDRIAHHQGHLDLVRPALLAFIVGGERRGTDDDEQ